MKFYHLVFPILLFTLNSFSQVNKAYITKDGKFSDSPQKAISYILVQKLSDTAYLMSKFDMRDTLMIRGSYKDSRLTTPHGKFYYYYKRKVDDRLKDVLHVDTNSYLQYSGFFFNGQKTGKWVEYAKRGIKGCIYSYENDKLNGLFQSFDAKSGTILQEGNFNNDKQEGEWNTYLPDSEKPIYTEIFKEDKLIKTIIHLKNAQPTVDLGFYLRKSLRHYKDSLVNKGLIVTMSVSEEGKVDAVKFSVPLTQDMNKAVTDAFLNYPKFHPCQYDGKAIRQICVFNFATMGVEDMITQQRTASAAYLLSRHTNEIGRGLNNVGFGKPIH